MDFQTVRSTYPHFIYHDVDICMGQNELKIAYHFEIEGLASFHPAWEFPISDGCIKPDLDTVRVFAFNLGMVELVSYWKATCSPNVSIRAAGLSPQQVAWWKKLYFGGLGEFFYINHISTSVDDFMHIQAEHEMSPLPSLPSDKLAGNLIPIGGGKDSIVTLDLLREMHTDNLCFIVNPTKARLATCETAGYTEAQVIIAKRTLDKNLLLLNKQGFFNGHTPLSAIIAFSSALAAHLYGKKYIILSNESSANDYTVTEAEVNHQYSKSYEFEKDFHSYINAFLGGDLNYFSLLRPFCELQIAKHFAALPAFHPVFNSCNLGSKFDGWCLNCPKCLFIYIMLSAFLSQTEIEAIFSENILNAPKMQSAFEQLVGLQKNKPFECVGSREEVNAAIIQTIRYMEARSEVLPRLLSLYKQTPLYAENLLHPFDYASYYDSDNLVPPEFERILRSSAMVKEHRV